MSVCKGWGRFGNQLIRVLAMSIISEKHDLYIEYKDDPKIIDKINKLGIKLFLGNRKFNESKIIDDEVYFDYFNKENINFNFNLISKCSSYFQTKKITDKIFQYLISDNTMNDIIKYNQYKDRYNNNNDCFIHIRLGYGPDDKRVQDGGLDKRVYEANPGFEYYDEILSNLEFKNLFISSDSLDHNIIHRLKEKYSNATIYENEIEDIIQFGSTCKYVILSYGTFSAIIGYLSFYSQVYCLRFCEKYAWDWNDPSECNMFQDKYSKISNWIIKG